MAAPSQSQYLYRYPYWDDVPMIWKVGGGRNIWYEDYSFIGTFIKEKRLTPMPNQTPFQNGASAPAKHAETRAAQLPLPDPGSFRGGIRVAHLHHDGQFYLLNNAQWAEFTKGIMQNVTEKINKAQKVSFEQLMDITEGTSGL